MSVTLDQFTRAILSRYPAVFHTANPISLGNRGGFSGASLWRVEAGGHSFCLRAWPSRQSDPARLDFLHGLMRSARIAGLSFVPASVRLASSRVVACNSRGLIIDRAQPYDNEGGIAHTPGRGHRRKSDPPQKHRIRNKAASARSDRQALW
jgi:hypothetical protein